MARKKPAPQTPFERAEKARQDLVKRVRRQLKALDRDARQALEAALDQLLDRMGLIRKSLLDIEEEPAAE